jgi:hypothetical protein
MGINYSELIKFQIEKKKNNGKWNEQSCEDGDNIVTYGFAN